MFSWVEENLNLSKNFKKKKKVKKVEFKATFDMSVKAKPRKTAWDRKQENLMYKWTLKPFRHN